MNSPICPLCDCKENQQGFSEKGYTLFSCNNCDLLFIHPYPSVSQIRERVSAYEYDDLEILQEEKQYQTEVVFYKRYFPLIEQECRGAKSFLDVGCGCGYLLETVATIPTVTRRVGIEMNHARARMARKNANCEIFETPLEEYPRSETFDVISIINVISHVTSLSDFLSSLRCLLAPKGKVILKTGEQTRKARKSAIYDWQIPDHLHFFGLQTTSFISREYGFEILRHERMALADEIFSQERFEVAGRSRFRNTIKGLIRKTPFALEAMKTVYKVIHGESIYSSFIVLRAD